MSVDLRAPYECVACGPVRAAVVDHPAVGPERYEACTDEATADTSQEYFLDLLRRIDEVAS